MRVLMVEDDVKMAGLVRRGLQEDGHAADVASTGEDAVWMAQAHPYDAIVLDVMLPGLSGFETCKRIRNAGVWSPVLMLTARDGVDDRVAGLDAGADDYLTKPFSFAELLARLRALALPEVPESAHWIGQRIQFWGRSTDVLTSPVIDVGRPGLDEVPAYVSQARAGVIAGDGAARSGFTRCALASRRSRSHHAATWATLPRPSSLHRTTTQSST